MNTIKSIDLAEFGGEGEVVVGPQTFSMKTLTKNELGKRAKIRVVDGEQILEYQDVGDVEIIKTLAFVRAAPFPRTVKGFLGYCDKLDEKEIGNGEKLFQAIVDAVVEITEAPSPLDN